MQCPCHSGETYENCCSPFHKGAFPPNALALMRSRYSAYALRNVDYIIQTTHPRNSEAKKPEMQRRAQIQKFSDTTQFEGLEILSFEENEPYSYVTFRAILSRDGQNISFTEHSQFEKIGERWLYLKGTMIR